MRTPGSLLSAFALVATLLASATRPALAEAEIEVSFEADAGSRQALVRAEALFPVRSASVKQVFASITAYPELHDWIRDTRLISTSANTEEFRVDFRFPWPVGKQWSRVEVRRHGDDAIEWRQIDGSLKANRGRIVLTSRDGKAHVDYQAAIDVGLPEAVSRHHKKKFVAEFLGAVYERANAYTLAAF
jgi:hypothetical protein